MGSSAIGNSENVIIRSVDWTAAEKEALELFQSLVRVDTTNPPGNETAAAELLADFHRARGFAPTLLESAPGRGNLIVRLKGDGTKPPLVLTAHLDVVPAEGDGWKHPPFGAEIHDGYLWGRGAVDMKNMAAMSAVVLHLLKESGAALKRDVIFAAVADEEAGSRWGAKWLVDHHPELVRAEYALGEIGGWTLHFGKVTYYPIQVAEKGTLWGKLRAKGTPGHGSMPREDNAVVRLAKAVSDLGRVRLPQHPSAPVEAMVSALAKEQGFPVGTVLKQVLRPALAPQVLKVMPASVRRGFAALLSNTATPTVLRAGSKTNVIPGVAEAEFDGRLAPGQTKDDLLREIREVVGRDVEIEVVDTTPPVEVPYETELFDALQAAVKRADPTGVPIPYVIPGFTDARAFTKLGIKYYGFAPLQLPREGNLAFTDLYHGNDERAPVEGFKWGLRLLFDAVKTFCET